MMVGATGFKMTLFWSFQSFQFGLENKDLLFEGGEQVRLLFQHDLLIKLLNSLREAINYNFQSNEIFQLLFAMEIAKESCLVCK